MSNINGARVPTEEEVNLLLAPKKLVHIVQNQLETLQFWLLLNSPLPLVS